MKGISFLLALGIWAGEPGMILTRADQEIRTTRITQLTGGYDPENKPFLNKTVPWRVAGVDLGANTEHKGKLYFFFGDVVPTGGDSWPPYDSDLIAYTQDASPEPNGFRLTPVARDGAFYPLLNRYTRWDTTTRTLTIYYLMSTGMPYQVQLMRSQIKVPN